MSHVMLDLETLGTSANSVIVTIGAAVFEPTGDDLIDTFYARLSIDDQLHAGRVVNDSTIVWWMGQSDEARSSTFGVRPIPTMSVLDSFTNWLCRHKVNEVWGNGADFDNAMLQSLYASFQLEAPWRFYNNRCFRTLKNIFIGVGAPVFEGEAHNAVADAVHQAQWAQAIFRSVKDQLA